MNDITRTKICELIHLASADVFWTKAPDLPVLRAAFESCLRRGKMQKLIHDIARAEKFAVGARLDEGLRDIADWVRDNGKADEILTGKLDRLALRFRRIEDRVEKEKANFFSRVDIYRRLPLNDDPLFADLKEDMRKLSAFTAP